MLHGKRILCLTAASLCLVAARAVCQRALYAPEASLASASIGSAPEGRATVQWRTGYEVGVARFSVFRGGRASRTDAVGQVSSGDSEDGSVYSIVDASATAGQSVAYSLWMEGRDGTQTWLRDLEGIVPSVSSVAAAPVTAPAAPPAAAPLAVTAGTQWWVGSRDRVLPWTSPVPADRVRLGVRSNGAYRVRFEDLALAWGRDAASVWDAMISGNLSLTCQGRPVAWDLRGSSLYFYGTAPASPYVPENVYWISMGPGVAMAARDATPVAGGVTNGSFTCRQFRQGTVHRTRSTYGTLTNIPYLGFASIQGGKSSTVNETLVDRAGGSWTGRFSIDLTSYCDPGEDTHGYLVKVGAGGVLVGTGGWTGEAWHTNSFSFAASNLSGSVLPVKIENSQPESWNAYMVWLSLAVEYERLYRAASGALLCTGSTGDTVAVTSFSTADARVWDVTDPERPAALTGTVLSPSGSVWTVAFAAGGRTNRYLAFSESTGMYLPSIRGAADVDWSSPAQSADYVILVPPEGWVAGFREGVEPLAAHRQRQGLVTRVIDVESVYNRYSYGLAEIRAIREFVANARTNWGPRPLRYLLLAGQGNIDFNHTLWNLPPAGAAAPYTVCLIPPPIQGMALPTEGMTVATDIEYGNVTGGSAPEVSVGRFPVVTTQQLAVVVRKTIEYEAASAARSRCSVAGDYSIGYNFTNALDADVVPALAGLGRRVLRTYPADEDPNHSLVDERVNSLLPAFQSGVAVSHYLGHSGTYNLGYNPNAALLKWSDVSPANWTKPSVGVLIGCHINRFYGVYDPTPFNQQYFGPYGFLTQGTGYAAVVAGTGYVYDFEGAAFQREFYVPRRVRVVRLGDVVIDALAGMGDGVPPERLLSFAILGDPALIYRNGTAVILR
jgi:hypothetical protein